MKFKKSIISILLALCVVLSFTACAPHGNGDETDDRNETTEMTLGDNTENTTEEASLDITTEENIDETTEKASEDPSETETEEPEVSVIDRITEILDSVPDEPVCRVENMLMEMVLSGKIEGYDYYSEIKLEGKKATKVTDGAEDYVEISKQRTLASVSGHAEFSEYTLIEGKVGEYELYGYIPGVSAEGTTVLQKWVIDRDKEEADTDESEESDSNFDKVSFIESFTEYSLKEEDGVYVITLSGYLGDSDEIVNELFNDSIASETIKDFSAEMHIDIQSCLPLIVTLNFELDFTQMLGHGISAEAAAEMTFEYYDEDYDIFPDNYADFVLVGDMSYRDALISEIEYYLEDFTFHESLGFESEATVDVYYSLDGESREFAASTYEKDVVNLGYKDEDFVYSIDADMTVAGETQKIKMVYEGGELSIYADGEPVGSEKFSVAEAVSVLDEAYYNKLAFEKYDIADLEVTENSDGTTTVIFKFNDMGKFESEVEGLGFSAQHVEVIEEKQVYTAYFDENMCLTRLESWIEGAFVDKEDGVIYYIEAMSAVKISGEADFSAIYVDIPVVET